MPRVPRHSPVVEAQGIGRRFGSRTVLTGIDLQITEGEIFGLLGPDGAGKTTLMQILAAILDPSTGTCRVLGFDTVRQADAVTSRIGYMSQGFTLYDRLTVDENLAFAARIRGIEGEAYRDRRRRLLSMAGLAAFVDRQAAALSGGMRKKLSLCTNLIHEPPLLLLDELSLGVDPVSRRELWQMLYRFREAGATIVVTTPYMDEAEACDRLALIDHGRLLAVDAPADLRRRAEGSVFNLETPRIEAALERLAGRPNVASLTWTGRQLRLVLRPGAELSDDTRLALQELGTWQPAPPTLEDVFVRMTAPAGAGREAVFLPPPGPRIAARDGVHLRDVTCRFGDFVAVDRVSLTVPAGEVFGFLGPNGAGKTTLIRAMCGLLKPDAGSIRVAGIDVLAEPARLHQRIGYMSQRFSLYTDLTAGENLAFFAGVYGLDGRARAEAIAWVSEMVGLGGLADQPVRAMSGAVRQRLALACSVMHRPAVLFLDEPTSGIDPRSRQRFWQLIQHLAGTGMTVFVTTHYLEEAIYCHRLGLMHEGRLIAAGSTPELREALALDASADMETIFMAWIARENRADESPVEAAS